MIPGVVMRPVAATADGDKVPARPYQVCGCDQDTGVARWVFYDLHVYWSIDECLSCGASWTSCPLEEE